MAIPFLIGIDVAGTVDLSNLTIDSAQGTDGQVLTSTGTGIAWEDAAGGASDTAERIEVTVKNVSGGSLSKGTVVHASPSVNPPSGNVIEVIAADYDDSTKMPAIGILNETIANGGEGSAVIMGAVSGIDTSSFSNGDELYVGNLGTLQNSKPATAGQLIQKIAVVIKSHVSNGLIKIFGAGRSNDVPLPLYIDNANQRVGISEPSPAEKLVVSEVRTGSTASDLYTTVVKSVQSAGASPNPGTGGLKVQYTSSSSNVHAFGLVAGSSSSDFLTTGPMHFYTNSDLDTVSATGYAMQLDTSQRLSIGPVTASQKLNVGGNVTADRYYGNGSTVYYVDPNDSTTAAILAGGLEIGHGSAGEYRIEVGEGRTGNGYAYIDFVGDTGYTDYGLRLIRNNTGANTSSQLIHRGTGTLNFKNIEAAHMTFDTSNTERMRIESGGDVGIGTNNPSAKLHVSGGHLRVDNSGGTDNYYLEFYESGAQRFRIYENSNNVYFDGGPGNTHFRPRQGGGSNNFIVTGANVGIGESNPASPLHVTGTARATGGVSTDGTAKSYTWRALDNTSSSSNQYYRIARITASQSTRFIIELAGRSTSYSDTSKPAFGKIVGQLNNDNNYDIVYYNASATDEVVDEVGQVDVSTTATDIYVRVGQFAELVATASISDGTIVTYGGDSASTSAPTNYVQATEYKLWNQGNDGAGTGLDADLLDGQEGSYYLNYNNFTNTPTLPTDFVSKASGGTFSGNVSIDQGTSGDAILTIRSDTDNNNEGDHPSIRLKQDGDLVDYRLGIGVTDGDTSSAPGNDFVITNITNNSATSFWYSPDNGTNSYRVFHDGYHPNADAWTTGRTLTLSGDLNGSVSIDGSANVTLSAQVVNNSHTHDDRYYTESESDGRFVNVTGDTMTGALNMGASDIVFQGADPGDLVWRNGSASEIHRLWAGTSTLNYRTNAGTTYELWHSGNDGAGSGLDADLLDGIQGADYFKKQNDIGGSVDLNTLTTDGYYHQNANANAASGSNYPVAAAGMLSVVSDGVMVYQTYHQYNGNAYYHRSYYNGAWYAWRKVWQDGNDGAGSGLDADLLDGAQGSSYLRSDTSDTFNAGLGGTLTVEGLFKVANPSATSQAMTISNASSGNVCYISNGNGGTIFFGVPASNTTNIDVQGTCEAAVFRGRFNTNYYTDHEDAGTSIRVAGDVVAYYSSDKRYKENIKPIESPIEKVKAISGVTFEWNEKSHKETGKKDIGVIAQEVEEVLPEIVQTRDNGYKAVDYQKLTAVLIEAVKEQQKQIDELKSIINGSS